MFNFLSSTTNTNGAMPASSSIKEANEHMQAMLKRIWDLEQRVKEQAELMKRREMENKVRIQNMERQKDLEMAGLQEDIIKVKDRCGLLEGLLKDRDVHIAYLFHRCSYLDEAASYVPLLDQLSQCLKSSLAAPPPKVQTVKPTRPTAASPTNPEYTPDVPIAPNMDNSNSALSADSPVKQQHHTKSGQYSQHYMEKMASVYATNPSVALNGHCGKK